MSLDLCCPVAAWNYATVPFQGFDEWRKQLATQRQSPTLSQTCKLGDEQTIVSAEAVFRAIDAAGWTDRSYEDWGIISAPQFLGRLRMAAALERYRVQDVRGASPRHIPTVSQHAVAGTLSVIFQCRGPCFGAGGSQGSVRDALVTAATLVSSGIAPGFWVTFSQWSPELLPNAPDERNAAARCHAVALAIVPQDSPEAAFELGVRFRPTLSGSDVDPKVSDVREFLEAATAPGSVWGRSLAPGLWVELRRRKASAPVVLPRVA